MSIHPIVKIFLTCLSGFILSLSAPGFDLWFIAWFGLIPLFIIINTSRKVKEKILYSFLFGFFYNLSYLHWLFSLHPLNWLGFNDFQSYLISFFALLFVSTYCSLYFVLFALCLHYFKKFSAKSLQNNKGFLSYLLITFFWLIIFNKIQSCKQLLGFPWTLIEYSQYKNLFLIQIAEYFGSIFIGFLIVFFNLVLSELVISLFSVEKISNKYLSKNPGHFIEIVKGFSFFTVLISISLVFGAFANKNNRQFFSYDSKSVCILQGNLPIKVTRGGALDIMLAKETYNSLITSNDAALIIAPEGSLPTIITSDFSTQHWISDIGNKKHSDVIFGSYCKNEGKLTNCAASYSPEKNQILYYEKERLVPFGEFAPLSFLLPGVLKRFADNVIGDGFKEGKQILPVVTSLGKVGINICYELIFPTIIRKHLLQGANFLVNISDLSWFSNDHVKQEFLAFAVFRAIENRKPFIVVTNNGISAFIDPSGKIRSQTLPNSQGVLLDWIKPNKKITFYAKYGW